MRAEVRYFEWPDLDRGADPAATTSTPMVSRLFVDVITPRPVEEFVRLCPQGLMLLAGRGSTAYGDGMASGPQTELRLSRLENDSNSLYELISDIRSTQQEHSRRFDTIDSTLADIVRRLPDPS